MKILKIIDKYIILEFFSYFFIGCFSFVVFMIGNTLIFDLMDFFITKKIPFFIAVQILGYQLPGFLVWSFPFSTLFSTLLAIGRLSRDSELDAIQTSRISLYRIMLPVLIVSILISWFTYSTNEYIVPYTNNQSNKIIRKFLMTYVLPEIKNEVFFKGPKGRYFYIGSINEQEKSLREILIYDMEEKPYPRVIIAPTGTWEKDIWFLYNGKINSWNKDGYIEHFADFNELKLDVGREIQELYGEQKTPQEMTFAELKNQINLFKNSGIETNSYETDLHFKISIPFTNLIFAFLALPLALAAKRASNYLGIVISIIISFFYYIFIAASRSLGSKGVLSPIVAAWSQNIIFLLIAIILIIRARK